MNDNSNQVKMTRKKREFLARRNEILDAATRLFANKGYHGTSMNEIAKEAEFSTGSLYNFFQNKEELYFSLLQEKIGALEKKANKVYEGEAPLEEKLRLYVDTVLGFFEKERDFFRIFVEQRSTFETSAKGKFSDVIHESYQRYLGNMVKLMEKGVTEGLLKPFHPGELALSFIGILNAFIIIFVNTKTETSSGLRDQGRHVIEIFFNGTRKDTDGKGNK